MASPGFPLRTAAGGAPRRIGMPRALLHYRYGTLWTAFFEELGCDVVVSDPTDRSTVARGDALSNDECCLASTIYLGHVASLVETDRCDAVFVPSIANVGRRRGFCTKFQALPDLVANTFADKRIELVSCLVNEVEEHKGMKDALIQARHRHLRRSARGEARLEGGLARAGGQTRRPCWGRPARWRASTPRGRRPGPRTRPWASCWRRTLHRARRVHGRCAGGHARARTPRCCSPTGPTASAR